MAFASHVQSVESPYTPLNAALAPKVAPPAVSQNVMTLPRRVRDALEDFYKEIYPEFGVDSPANIKGTPCALVPLCRCDAKMSEGGIYSQKAAAPMPP